MWVKAITCRAFVFLHFCCHGSLHADYAAPQDQTLYIATACSTLGQASICTSMLPQASTHRCANDFCPVYPLTPFGPFLGCQLASLERTLTASRQTSTLLIETVQSAERSFIPLQCRVMLRAHPVPVKNHWLLLPLRSRQCYLLGCSC